MGLFLYLSVTHPAFKSIKNGILSRMHDTMSYVHRTHEHEQSASIRNVLRMSLAMRSLLWWWQTIKEFLTNMGIFVDSQAIFFFFFICHHQNREKNTVVNCGRVKLVNSTDFAVETIYRMLKLTKSDIIV